MRPKSLAGGDLLPLADEAEDAPRDEARDLDDGDPPPVLRFYSEPVALVVLACLVQ